MATTWIVPSWFIVANDIVCRLVRGTRRPPASVIRMTSRCLTCPSSASPSSARGPPDSRPGSGRRRRPRPVGADDVVHQVEGDDLLVRVPRVVVVERGARAPSHSGPGSTRPTPRDHPHRRRRRGGRRRPRPRASPATATKPVGPDAPRLEQHQVAGRDRRAEARVRHESSASMSALAQTGARARSPRRGRRPRAPRRRPGGAARPPTWSGQPSTVTTASSGSCGRQGRPVCGRRASRRPRARPRPPGRRRRAPGRSATRTGPRSGWRSTRRRQAVTSPAGSSPNAASAPAASCASSAGPSPAARATYPQPLDGVHRRRRYRRHASTAGGAATTRASRSSGTGSRPGAG